MPAQNRVLGEHVVREGSVSIVVQKDCHKAMKLTVESSTIVNEAKPSNHP